MPLMPAFRRRPGAASIVGRLIAGYGDLELLLSYCLGPVMASRRKPLSSHSPSMHRDRYERIALKQVMRIHEAKKRFSLTRRYMAPSFTKARLRSEFDYTMNAMFQCRLMRNHFAHCLYAQSKKRGLFFCDLEEASKAKGKIVIEFRHATTEQLGDVEDYFWHTFMCLDYLYNEYALRTRLIRSHACSMPQRKPQLKRPNHLFPHKTP